jgi:hypothetical protein
MLQGHATHPGGGYGVEAGIMDILTRMQTNRFKVFSHLKEWWDEFRLYHRKDGKIVKERDDIMDATRTGVMMIRYAVDAALMTQMESEDDDRRSVNATTGY